MGERLLSGNRDVFNTPASSSAFNGSFNLITSVERARVCGFRVGWQGATRRMAAPCNEEQRGQEARKRCNRVRSGFTFPVNVIEDENSVFIVDSEA